MFGHYDCRNVVDSKQLAGKGSTLAFDQDELTFGVGCRTNSDGRQNAKAAD
jgi:hypothetical protein